MEWGYKRMMNEHKKTTNALDLETNNRTKTKSSYVFQKKISRDDFNKFVIGWYKFTYD